MSVRAQPTPSRDRPPDDDELMRRVAAGDHGALIALYRRHGGMVLAQVVLMVGGRGASEEILQDTMLAVGRGGCSR